MALNAHCWELLQCTVRGSVADPSLVLPPEGRLDALVERTRRLTAPLWRRRVRSCARGVTRAADEAVTRAQAMASQELDLPELARGPLSERSWSQILTIWLADRLLESGDPIATARIQRAIEIESRFMRLLGERLVERGALERPADAAYLTVEERLAAVNDPAGPWREHLSTRIQRAQEFLDVEVPEVFWGQPRVSPA
jgi:hypothetical protein